MAQLPSRPGYGADRQAPSESRNGPGPVMNRADRFEDEKRRFIESCFSKKDTDGSVIESYITHIRITEDAAHPTTPPPPTSPPENKKPRLIVVAVRKSGRVRLHKARENTNGTFSIGKTWVLDDLTAIQAYAGLVPNSQAEQQQIQWAADVGFLVTIGKPYYWQAATAKEKDFFIASLVKIYKKYTGGKLPTLNGFGSEEKESLMGGSLPPSQPRPEAPRSDASMSSIGPRPPSSQGRPSLMSSRNRTVSPEPSLDRDTTPTSYQSRPMSRDSSRQEGLQAGYYNRAPSRDGNYEQRPPQAPYSNRAPSREGNREARGKPSEEMFLRNKASREQMQRPGPYLSSRQQQQNVTPQSSLSQSSKDHASSPAIQPPNGAVSTPPLFSQNEKSLRNVGSAPSVESFETTGSMQNQPLPQETSRFVTNRLAQDPDRNDTPFKKPEPPSANSNHNVEIQPASGIIQESPPERRRPLQGPNGSFGQRSANSDTNEKFSTPMGTPSQRDLDTRAPSRGSEMSPSNVPNSKATNYPRADTPKEAPINTAKPDSNNSETDSRRVNGEADSLSSVHDALSDQTPLSETASLMIERKEEEETFRPGLGPMMKKKSTKDLAKTLKLAATAYGAFKPRAGGAVEKFLADKEKQSSEPDGITGVVPAPLQRGLTTDSPRSGTPDLKDRPLSPTNQRPFSPMGVTFKQEAPKVQITRTVTDGSLPPEADEAERPQSPDRSRSRSPEHLAEKRRKRKSDNTSKYLNALGIDPSILEGRGSEFDNVLTELGWHGKLNDDKTIEDLEADVRREIGRAQAGSWLDHLEQQEGKIEQLGKMFDKVMNECDELDGLLTLYAHELNTLTDDIAYIEAQSQGLQVQTANQKLLQTELQKLLDTLSISPAQLQPLKEGSLTTPDGVEKIETALSTLYQAMVKIDPSIRNDGSRQPMGEKNFKGMLEGSADHEISQMRAVREKRDVYQNESLLFVQRLQQYMSKAFKTTARRTVESIERSNKQLRSPTYKPDPMLHDGPRQEIWMYSPLMLFTRDVDTVEWEGMLRSYEESIKAVYQEELRDSVTAWTNSVRRSSGEEQEILFTNHHDKEPEGITTAARKLTVKRGKAVRVAGGGLRSTVGDKQDGKMEPYEAFSGALEEMTTLTFEEQNFVTHFFHATSHSSTGFADAIAAARPQHRTLPKLSSRQSFDPDRDMAKRVSKIMDGIFPSWNSDVQSMIDLALKPDRIQAVGVLYAVEHRLSDFEETSQEFLVRNLQKIHNHLTQQFSKFVDEQVHGIEETKVKIKKRKGVIAFMRIFPHFSAAIENMIPGTEGNAETLEVRFTVNDAYTKILRAMWESLKFIAKESPAAGQSSGGDPEDKEVLNYHILLIENMNHYVEEVEARDNIVLEEWRDRATHDMNEHLKLYLDAVIRRPLGKLLDFIESVESLLQTVSPASNIATRASHSRTTAKKVFSGYDSKEIRRGIDTLRKRVDKHFGDADDPGLSRSLVGKILRELESRYSLVWERATRINEVVYEKSLEIEWTRDDALSAFRR